MSRTHLSLIQRRSILEANRSICGYCYEPLAFSEMEVDHILPIELAQDEVARTARFREVGIGDDFDLNSLLNFAPACRPCNQRKHNLPLAPGRIAIMLAHNANIQPKIDALVAKYISQAENEKFRLSILTGIESGSFNLDEILSLLQRNDERPGTTVLSGPYEIFPGQTIFEIDPEAINRLFDFEIDVNDEPGMKLRLVKGDNWNAWDEEVYVNTLNQYIEATEAGFYAVTNMEMKLADSWFETKIALLRKLLAARVPDRTFLGNHFSVNDIRYVPACLLFMPEDITEDEAFAGERASLGTCTVRDLVARREAVIKDTASGLLRVEYDDHETLFIEQFRADVDGDGLEEVVVYWAGRPLQGTMRVSGILTLRKTSEEGLFEELVE